VTTLIRQWVSLRRNTKKTIRSTHHLDSAPILGKLIAPLRILVMVFASLLSLLSQTVDSREKRVTAVQGESWLNHLHRSFDCTNMGRIWRFGPRAPTPGERTVSWQPRVSPGLDCQTVTLHGSDLYRLNCRGCHGESGLGVPPEINSLVNPVRATSVPVIMERMKNLGMDMSRGDATVLATQANSALLERLHKGGQDMPAFPQLNEAEIRSLVPYLKLLAGIPRAEREQTAVTSSSSLHVGEQIVKSTCHICHGAAGPNPGPQQLLDGAIPPLSMLTWRTSLPQFVRKVTQGAPILMGTPPLPCRGRMSVFYYLSQDEVASAYLYLTRYPPQK
jgi:mono/diheme cytochrome c family protein